MPISSARMKTMFGGCTYACTLTAAASRQAANTVVFIFQTYVHKLYRSIHKMGAPVGLMLPRDLVQVRRCMHAVGGEIGRAYCTGCHSYVTIFQIAPTTTRAYKTRAQRWSLQEYFHRRSCKEKTTRRSEKKRTLALYSYLHFLKRPRGKLFTAE